LCFGTFCIFFGGRGGGRGIQGLKDRNEGNTSDQFCLLTSYIVKYFYRYRHRNERYRQPQLLKVSWECVCKKSLFSELRKEEVLEHY